MSNLVDYAKDELKMIGMIDSGEPYNDVVAKAILDLIELFASQGHSGFTAPYTVDTFSRLAMFKPLSNGLKPATPKSNTGHWTIKQYQVPIENIQVPTISGTALPTAPTACKIIYTYTHSVCKSEEYLNKYNYCPNCGAKMEVKE